MLPGAAPDVYDRDHALVSLRPARVTHVPPDDGSRFAPAGPDPFRDALAAALAPAYDLGRELEGGGMSRVFVAEEARLGRRVVVKVLPPELGRAIDVARFQREMRLAATLRHPHVVPVLTAGESTDGLFYFTMPFIEGESLRASTGSPRACSGLM